MARSPILVAYAVVLLHSSAVLAALVSHWRGENNANDSVGSNHEVTVGQVNYVPGVVGQAFRFPDNGYINVPNPAAGGLVSPTGFTIAGWIRLDGADPPPEGGPGAIFNYGTPANSSGFVVMQNGLTGGASPLAFLVNTTGNPGFTVLTTPLPYWNLGQVYHLAATFDAATHTMAIYRDGQLEASRSDVPGTTMATNPAATFEIARAIPTGATFDGMLDEARFYNHALSAAEVQALIPEPPGAAVAALLMIVIAGVNMRTRRY
jgi:hypothetical protein